MKVTGHRRRRETHGRPPHPTAKEKNFCLFFTIFLVEFKFTYGKPKTAYGRAVEGRTKSYNAPQDQAGPEARFRRLYDLAGESMRTFRLQAPEMLRRLEMSAYAGER
jgi:hypothetical protein